MVTLDYLNMVFSWWRPIYSWWATFFCVFLSVRMAQVFLTHNYRIFTAFSLLALVWALLLPYYEGIRSENPPSEILSALSGFLLVFIGGLVDGEMLSQQRKKENDADTTSRINRLALWLLPSLAVPLAISLPFPEGKGVYASDFISKNGIEIFFGTIYYILGFILIILSCRKFLKPYQFKFILCPAIVYIVLEIIFAYELLTNNDHVMGAFLQFGFAIAKIVFTTSFVCLIADRVMVSKVKNLSFYEKLEKFFHI